MCYRIKKRMFMLRVTPNTTSPVIDVDFEISPPGFSSYTPRVEVEKHTEKSD